MSKSSLQDQLLKMGLTDKKKAKQAEKHVKKQKKVQRKTGAEDETKLRAEQARKEKADRDRELNLQKKAEEEKKAIQAQVKQLIEMNRLGDEVKGDVPHNFVLDKKVKKINVTAKISDQLAKGRLAIAELEGTFELIPPKVAEKILQREADWPIVLNEKAPDTGDEEEDDPYADFQIPDDLMW